MPMSRLLAGSRVMSAPATVIWPASASSSPASSRSVVVLPQPDGPSKATSSPACTVRSSPSRATTGPYLRLSPSIRTSTAVLAALFCVLVMGELTCAPSSLAAAAPTAGIGQDRQEAEGKYQRGRRGGAEHSGMRSGPAEVISGVLPVVVEQQAG